MRLRSGSTEGRMLGRMAHPNKVATQHRKNSPRRSTRCFRRALKLMHGKRFEFGLGLGLACLQFLMLYTVPRLLAGIPVRRVFRKVKYMQPPQLIIVSHCLPRHLRWRLVPDHLNCADRPDRKKPESRRSLCGMRYNLLNGVACHLHAEPWPDCQCGHAPRQGATVDALAKSITAP